MRLSYGEWKSAADEKVDEERRRRGWKGEKFMTALLAKTNKRFSLRHSFIEEGPTQKYFKFKD